MKAIEKRIAVRAVRFSIVEAIEGYKIGAICYIIEKREAELVKKEKGTKKAKKGRKRC
jgi:hypothetical protein